MKKLLWHFKMLVFLVQDVLKIFIEDGQIKTERVIIEEIKVDDIESYYGKPRQIHQEKYIQKSVLKEMFPRF